MLIKMLEKSKVVRSREWMKKQSKNIMYQVILPAVLLVKYYFSLFCVTNIFCSIIFHSEATLK